MEKLNIVWIKKWKIKRNLISVMTKIKAFFEKRNWNYVAIIAIIFGGAVVVYTSCGDGSLDVKKIKSSARKRRISGLFRKLGIEA